jgi:flagellar protein FliS
MSTVLRNRFHTDGTAAMPQERILLALYERLLADLDHAAAAIGARDLNGSHDRLVHAQQIIEELHLALDPKAWDGAGQLASLYLYANERLVEANLRKDVGPVLEVRGILAPLAATWRQAYEQLASTRTGAAETRQPAAAGSGRFEFGA